MNNFIYNIAEKFPGRNIDKFRCFCQSLLEVWNTHFSIAWNLMVTSYKSFSLQSFLLYGTYLVKFAWLQSK